MVRCNKGTSAVELGMLLPVIVFMFLGAFDGGMVLWTRHTLQYAVEETARYAYANPTASDSALVSKANSYLSGFGSPASCCTTYSDGSTTYRQLTITYNYQWLTPFVTSSTVTSTVRIPQ